jgi:urocanate hydratase
VLDGSADASRRLQLMLNWDVNNGIARRAWARNAPAEFAIARAMERDPLLRVTMPAHAPDDVVDGAIGAAFGDEPSTPRS